MTWWPSPWTVRTAWNRRSTRWPRSSGGASRPRRRAGPARSASGRATSGEAIPATDTLPLSASRLEQWAACGFRYYLAHLLGLAERDDPERLIEISPRPRPGVHAALERFLLDVLAAGAPQPHEPWTDEHRRRLLGIAAEVFDDYEARGRTGRAVHWKLDRTGLLALLDSFLQADDRHRAAHAARPERVELAFGMEGAEPVTVSLADGRVLAFRGRADRVDRGGRAGDRVGLQDGQGPQVPHDRPG
ncbi:MAG: PD-(D/E)XK nuclease family protein [Acidimicrobiales bacterium]